jgi:hypothetical protein
LSSRRVLIVILVGCLLVVCLYLGMEFFRQNKTQNELTSQIKIASQALNLVQTPDANLSAQLIAVEREFRTALQSVSVSEVNSTQIIQAVFNAADEFQLKANPLSSVAWSKKSIEGSLYRVMPVSLKIEGSRTAFLSFLKRLENRDSFPCVAVESLSMTEDSGLNNQISAPTTALVTAEINIVIFQRLDSGN